MGWLAFQKSQLRWGSGYGISQVRLLSASHQETMTSVHSTRQHAEKGHMVGETSLIHSFDIRESRCEIHLPLGKALLLFGPCPPSGLVCVIPSPAYALSLLNPGMTESLGDCPFQHTGFAVVFLKQSLVSWWGRAERMDLKWRRSHWKRHSVV